MRSVVALGVTLFSGLSISPFDVATAAALPACIPEPQLLRHSVDYDILKLENNCGAAVTFILRTKNGGRGGAYLVPACKSTEVEVFAGTQLDAVEFANGDERSNCIKGRTRDNRSNPAPQSPASATPSDIKSKLQAAKEKGNRASEIVQRQTEKLQAAQQDAAIEQKRVLASDRRQIEAERKRAARAESDRQSAQCRVQRDNCNGGCLNITNNVVLEACLNSCYANHAYCEARSADWDNTTEIETTARKREQAHQAFENAVQNQANTVYDPPIFATPSPNTSFSNRPSIAPQNNTPTSPPPAPPTQPTYRSTGPSCSNPPCAVR